MIDVKLGATYAHSLFRVPYMFFAGPEGYGLDCAGEGYTDRYDCMYATRFAESQLLRSM